MSRESALSQIESQIAPPAAPVEEALAQTGIITESTPQPGPDAASTPPAALVTEDAPLGESE